MADSEMMDVSQPINEPDISTNITSSNQKVVNYGLSAVISAHKSDVKALIATPSGSILSGGRDEKICLWTKKSGTFNETVSYPQPKGMVVNSLAFYNSPEGWRFFAGRKDGSIVMYGSGNNEPLKTFNQHKNNVCCLHVDEKQGVLMSGSWDTHVILWKISEMCNDTFSAYLCEGHTLSVWALASIPERPDYYLSASADKTIRSWHIDSQVHVFNGHTDVVRTLHVFDRDRFLSGANDGTIRLWHFESGACLGKFRTQSHDFIYSMTQLDSYVLTCGEDGSVEFWTIHPTGEHGQIRLKSDFIMVTPSTTTWDVKVLPSTDVIVAGSDGRIYIFSKDPERQASQAIKETYDVEIADKMARQITRNEQENSDTIVIKVALDEGPAKLELRYKKGQNPRIAAEQFITENNLPNGHLDEIIDYICTNIPEAAAARNNARPQKNSRVLIDGKEYDYGFEVVTDDGRKLMMPYNVGEDFDYAAQRFVEKHKLPVSFLPSLSHLIRSQISQTANSSSSNYQDPFTGGGRYVPSPNTGSLGGNGYDDPFTGSGRYVPGAMSTGANSGFSGDPYTGQGGYRTGDAAGVTMKPLSSIPVDKKRPKSSIVPVPHVYKFGPVGVSLKAIAKLQEINEKQTDLKLNNDQITALGELMKSDAPPTATAAKILENAFDMALQWEKQDLIPVLDFFRLALLHPELNHYYCSKSRGAEILSLFTSILRSEPDAATRAFICRSIANAFVHSAGQDLLVSSKISTLVPLIVKQLFSTQPAQIAAASALCNFSYVLLRMSESCNELGPREDILQFIIEGIENVSSFGDMAETALIRLLQAIVTLMWGDTSVIKLAKDRKMSSLAARLKDAIPSDAGKDVARDIVEMTYAV